MTTVQDASPGLWSAKKRSNTALRPVAPNPARGLRGTLVLLDLVAAATAWGIAMHRSLTDGPSAIAVLTFVTLVALAAAALGSQRLYLARACAIRTEEIRLIARASVASGLSALLVPRLLPVHVSGTNALVGAVLLFLLVNGGRAGFRAWLQAGRRRGRYLRQIVIIGGNDEAFDLFKLVTDHPETGFAVAAVAGEAMDFPPSVARLTIGPALAQRVRDVGANGVIIASSALHHVQLNRLVRDFHRADIHVHLSSGLRGVDHRRLRSQPVAHEPLFYVESMSLAPWQLAVKRALDLVGGVVVAILAAPLLIAAAIAIKVGDPGPILYRQVRPGRDETPFTIWKLRTMIVGADRLEPNRVDDVMGPRSKEVDDPRRTRVGRFLERTSIDELPQIWNVLRGDMSLVGPRPALSHEAAQFDDDLKARYSVPPGVTGLWQVEARDNPSFTAYRRYDLFYIENWSVGLDLAILVSTLQQVAIRALRALPRRSPPVKTQLDLTAAK